MGRPSEIAQFLRLAIGIATALAQVHRRGLIHKDIKPANVLVNSVTGQVWLTGFGIASRLPREGTVKLSKPWADGERLSEAWVRKVALALEISRQAAKARSREARRKSAQTDLGYGM